MLHLGIELVVIHRTCTGHCSSSGLGQWGSIVILTESVYTFIQQIL